MLLSLSIAHPSAAAAYFSSFDYNPTHFIRALTDGSFLNSLLLWVTFTGSLIFMLLITIALYLAGAQESGSLCAGVYYSECHLVRTKARHCPPTIKRFRSGP
jgi:hypothetical protein